MAAYSDIDSGDDYDEYIANEKLLNSGANFNREVRSVEDLAKIPRSRIEVLKPDYNELQFELTDDVPKGDEVPKEGHWSIRIRTDLPEKYHHMKIVIVSILLLQRSY